MKKLLVLVLALVLVVSLASVSFAATATYGGKVAVKLSNGLFAQDAKEANFVFDYTKTYSDQLSAGLNVKWDSTNGDHPEKVFIDGSGWVKFNYSPLVVTAKTSIDGNAADTLGGEFASNGGPGVQVDYTVIEGATLTVVANDTAYVRDADAFGLNYVAKGVYNANGLKLGAGYQAGQLNTKDAFAVFGSYTFAGITVGGEYASRLQVAKFDGTVGTTAMAGTVAATFGPLTVNGKFQKQDSNYKTMAAGDADGKSAYDAYKVNGYEGMAVLADATYKVTDALSVYGAVQDIMSGKQLDTDAVTVVDVKKPMSFKAGVTYALTSSLKADASFKSIAFTKAAVDADAAKTTPEVDVDTKAINLTVTNTFAAGLEGSLSLDMDLAAKTQSYTVKVTATL